MNLIEDAALSDAWRRALGLVADDASAHPLLRGQATRALYDHGILAPEPAALHLSRALSHSVPALAAADWLDGFLGQSGQILLHDRTLRRIIDGWLVSIGAEEFNNLLPVLRRAFSTFDRNERRRLLDELAKMPPMTAPLVVEQQASCSSAPLAEEAPGFSAALPLLLTILGAESVSPQELSS
jgi:hypothetical protein